MLGLGADKPGSMNVDAITRACKDHIISLNEQRVQKLAESNQDVYFGNMQPGDTVVVPPGWFYMQLVKEPLVMLKHRWYSYNILSKLDLERLNAVTPSEALLQFIPYEALPVPVGSYLWSYVFFSMC